MAKSIRSKHRRKMRNVKREHYAKKDLEKLMQVVNRQKSGDLENLVTMKSAEDLKANKQSTSSTKRQNNDDSTMEVDTGKTHNKKTKQDEHGHYPPWMNQRAVKKQKQKNVKSKKRVGKKIKW